MLAVAGVPEQPQHFYFGAVNGGVWETLDAGRTWQPVFDDEPVGSIGAIALAASDPKVMYAGSGEADMRSDIAQGDVRCTSRPMPENTGRRPASPIASRSAASSSIRTIRTPSSLPRWDIRMDRMPSAACSVRAMAARIGNACSAKAWTPARSISRSTSSNAHTIYAALWQTRQHAVEYLSAREWPRFGLCTSRSTVAAIGRRCAATAFRNTLAGSVSRLRQDPHARLCAFVDGDTGGLYRSDDAGAHWRKTSGDPRIWQRGWYFGRIAVDPQNADRVYAMNTIVLRSDDGGAHFIPLKGDPTGDDFHELWIDPTNPDRQILGVDQGAVVTLNGGKTWSSWDNQPTAQMYHVSTDNRFPYRVYGSQQDSGAVELPSAATGNANISMEQFKEVTAGGESGMIAPDPDDPDIVYGGDVDKLDLRTEQTQSVDPTLADPDELYRRTWTLPLVFSKRDPKVLHFTCEPEAVSHGRCGGAHWGAISPDLTRGKSRRAAESRCGHCCEQSWNRSKCAR